jgi:NADPH-dependent 2,4-dienoyl-CoA reductase/sulfur reductase-like enzyme
MVSHEPKFLSENLIIFPAAGKGPKYLFIFPRPLAATVEQMVENLRERLREHGPVGVETRLAAVESE